MVQAVHSQRILAQKGPKRAAGRQRYTVYRHIIGRRLVVVCRRRVLSGQVLIQCAAKMDIQKLNAAADAQHGLVRRQRKVKQPCLHRIARRAGLAALRRRRGTVQGRENILPARQQKAVAGIGQLPQCGGIIRQRQHNGHAARLLHPLHIAGQHPVALARLIHQRHDPNQRLFHSSSHTSL